MQRFHKVPFIFLLVASLMGLLLRWNFVEPVSWLKFPYWLHGHSHLMFLGWVFNTLFLFFTDAIAPEKKSRYLKLFVVVQVLLAGMLISFPLQGYGAISITLSTLHTLAIFVYCGWIYSDAKNSHTLSTWFAKRSLLFFLLSSLGPFTLGPLVANGLGQSPWYYFSVYYYLHFQYNGVFLFGIFSLLFRFLEEKNFTVDRQRCLCASRLMFWAVFPCYALSLLWARPGLIVNVIGFAGGILQLVALVMLIQPLRRSSKDLLNVVKPRTKPLLVVAGLSFIIKVLLQVLSADQTIADLAYEIRPFTIAYLHLVLIGVITFTLLAWYHEQGIVALTNFGTLLILVGFIGSEVLMIVGPLSMSITPWILLLFSFALVVGIVVIVRSTLQTRLNTR